MRAGTLDIAYGGGEPFAARGFAARDAIGKPISKPTWGDRDVGLMMGRSGCDLRALTRSAHPVRAAHNRSFRPITAPTLERFHL
ncbi:MAG TPA: hypothetical protein VFP84_38100 [Kofleriaceae bacterium]|nr:hypothetical protein [Kofleriaceae bacterium]